MTRTSKLALVAAVGALLVAGGVASAKQGFMNHGPGAMGGMAGAGLMQRYDANQDGKISQDEITQNRKATYDEFDANKDGKLGLDEFQALWLKMHNPQVVREFQFFDKNGDGQVTMDEYQAPLANIVANRDMNKDGFLSRDDRPAMSKKGWRHGKGQGRHGGWQQGGQMDGSGWGPGMMMGEGGQPNPQMMQMHQRMMQQGWGCGPMMQQGAQPPAQPGAIPPPPPAVGQPVTPAQ